MEAGIHPQAMDINGRSLRFTLSLPETPTRGAPLVLCLHYAGHGTPWYGRALLESLVEPVLRPLQAVMVAPDCPGHRWTNAIAEDAVMALLDATAARWQTDPGKVVVIGYSMGGMGAWHYASGHPDRFAAAVSIAGRPQGALPTVPMFVVHSLRDEVVDIGPDETAVKELLAAGQEVVFRPLNAPTHYDVPGHAQGLAGVVPWLQLCWTAPESGP